MTILFFATTVICAIGWINRYLSCMAILYYLEKREYRMPNEQEIKEATLNIISHLFNGRSEKQ